MADGKLPPGNSTPIPGGLDVGYSLNSSDSAQTPISMDEANVIYTDEKCAEADYENSQRRGPCSYLDNEHMGPERLG